MSYDIPASLTFLVRFLPKVLKLSVIHLENSSKSGHFCSLGDSRAHSQFLVSVAGQVIDSAANGPAPGPWDIAINVPGLFQQNEAEVEVPHTASIKVSVCSVIPLTECASDLRIKSVRYDKQSHLPDQVGS